MSYSVPSRPVPDLRRRRIAQMRTSTIVLCVGVGLTAISLPTDSPTTTFTFGAYGTAFALACAIAIEAQAGLRNLIRTDILMLVALFGLTFLEFLFPQVGIDSLVSASAAVYGTQLTLVGFAGLAIGRLFFPPLAPSRSALLPADLSTRMTFTLFLVVAVLGYAHIFIAVDFDPFLMVRQMLAPRFSQSWARERIGGWSTIMVEIGALIYLIPPIAGVIFSAWRRYSILQQLFVLSFLGLTLFYGFAGGTRNVFATYVITLVGAYLVMLPRLRARQIFFVGLPTLAVLGVAFYYMAEIRTVGLSNYSFEKSRMETLSLDYNIVNISRLTTVFPESHEYLGFEIPFNAIIRPIPRAIWSGKPEGLSLSIEKALGAVGLTLSTTYIGEAYMSGGAIGVILASLFFGAVAGWWNRLDSPDNTNFQRLLFVSGFFWAAICMRSALVVGPAVLPTLALWTYGKVFLGRRLAPRLPDDSSDAPQTTGRINSIHRRTSTRYSA